MWRVIASLLFLSATCVASETEGFSLNAQCYAWTQCYSGVTVSCSTYAPCRWFIQPYRFVECDGYDVFGQYVFVHQDCF